MEMEYTLSFVIGFVIGIFPVIIAYMANWRKFFPLKVPDRIQNGAGWFTTDGLVWTESFNTKTTLELQNFYYNTEVVMASKEKFPLSSNEVLQAGQRSVLCKRTSTGEHAIIRGRKKDMYMVWRRALNEACSVSVFAQLFMFGGGDYAEDPRKYDIEALWEIGRLFSYGFINIDGALHKKAYETVSKPALECLASLRDVYNEQRIFKDLHPELQDEYVRCVKED